MNVMERKQEAKNPFYRVVELTDETVDPEVWGKNFPLQYDDYKRTVDQSRTRYGGSEAFHELQHQLIRVLSFLNPGLKKIRALRQCGPDTLLQ